MEENKISEVKEPILKRIGRALRKAAAVLGLSSKPKIRGDLKENNSILKRFGKVLKKAIAIAGIVGVFVFGGLAIKGGIDNQQYIDTATIEMNMEEFGVENPYLMKGAISNSYRRLANNGDEPIYVSFDRDFEEEKILDNAAKYSVDYLFGVVSEINPSYKYEIVSNGEAEKQDSLGKSVIYFEFDSHMEDKVLGKNVMNLDIQDLAYWDLINTSNKVLVNKNMYEKYKEILMGEFKTEVTETALFNISTNFLTHELMHVFGFNDVYDIGSKFYQTIFKRIIGMDKIDLQTSHKDTLIDPGNTVAHEVRELTVKDYATLCALYMPKVSAENRGAEIERLSQMIKNYESEKYESKFSDAINSYSIHWGVNPSRICTWGNISEIEFRQVLNRELYIYNIQIIGNEYKFHIYDEAGNTLDSCSGKVYSSDGFIVLKDCKLENGVCPYSEGLYSNQVVSDVFLFNYASTMIWNEDGSYSYKKEPRMYVDGVDYIDNCTYVASANEASLE